MRHSVWPILFLLVLLHSELFARTAPTHSVRKSLKEFHFSQRELATTRTLLSSKTTLNRKLLKEIKRHPAFQADYSLFRESFHSNQMKTFQAWKRICLKNREVDHLNPIAQFYAKKTISNCLTRSMEYLKTKRFLKLSLHYLNERIADLFSSKQLSNKLKLLLKHDHLKQSLSSLIADYFITHPKDLDHSFFSVMEMPQHFKTYLQENRLYNLEDQIHFRKIFRSIMRETRKAVGHSSISIREKVQELLSYHQENRHFLRHQKAMKQFTLLIRTLIQHQHGVEAKQVLDYLKPFAHNKETQNTLWFLHMWRHIFHHKFDAALNVIEDHFLVDQFSTLIPKLQFWVAYTFHKNNQTILAEHLFKQMTQKNTFSFYNVMAKSFLTESETELTPKKLIQAKLRSPELQRALKRSALWIATDRRDLFHKEWTHIEKLIKKEANKKDVSYTEDEINQYYTKKIVRYLNSQKEFLALFQYSSRLDRDMFRELKSEILPNLFPTPYFPLIKKHAEKINPLIVLSLMRQESAFNPSARSHVGARGLMQIMPKTAKWLSNKATTKKLAKPSYNIKLGIQYLERLQEQFGGNLIFTLASYNAGEGNVKRWIKSRFHSSDPHIVIESIPFHETRNYVKYIYRNLYFYNQFIR